jgi:Chaperone of endosialidase
VGDDALQNNNSGDENTALGFKAGLNATTGAGNVYIGSQIIGVAGESNHTYIRNIKDTTVSGGGTDTVTVNLTTGLLGHLSSSKRYKEDIKSMDSASEALYRIKPVTYHYKKEIDATQSLDYGLVAEDVAQVDPNLAI